MFKPVDSKVNFPKTEEKILSFWKENNIFEKSIQSKENSPHFIFYDGPPFATGLPHFGHFVPSTLKDIIPRYKSMQGYYVSRRWGWDTHGLPVEYEVEKSLKVKDKSDIEKMGIEKFNNECRQIVLRHSQNWQKTIERLGRWVDFKNCYTTMSPEFMESVWSVFKKLFDSGLIYKGYHVLPYSPKLSTPLSNFEVSLGEYKEVHTPAVTIKFPLKDEPKTYFLSWTTTPWTLPTNLALALNPNSIYCYIKTKTSSQETFIIVKERIYDFFEENSFEITKEILGKDLESFQYNPPFNYYLSERYNGAFRVYLADYVTTTSGTGIVHNAPFGEEDFQILKKTQINIPVPLDEGCYFTSEIPEVKGLFIKEADKIIIRLLEKTNYLFKKETITHRYPFCYRTGSPLIYRPISCWFVKVENIKDKMIANNEKIHWHPSHLKKGRFGKWLEGARDWVISRNRFWGNPVPIWECDISGHQICVSSREELENLSGKSLSDWHRPYIDDITWPSPAGGTYRRVKEVLDCWFESGSMPYAQVHYPFSGKEQFEKNFPADFIAEGGDQTRGWFYTLTILSTALFNKPAFKNVIVNGLVLASDGKKMSKSLKNYTDPLEVINLYGADALRLYLVKSSVVKAEDLKYSDEGVKDVLKNVLIPLWNAYSFFTTYANIDKYKPKDIKKTPINPLDLWIVSEIESLNAKAIKFMDNYKLTKLINSVINFIDILNNWYIRRSRRRFWKSENDQDKIEAYNTLYYVLKKLITLISPFIPFTTEAIYQNLKDSSDPLSIHLCSYPKVSESSINPELEEKIRLIQKAVSMGRSLRKSLEFKNRQPLRRLHLITKNEKETSILREMEDILLEELNVKEIFFRDNEEDLVDYTAKANYRVLGKIFGSRMNQAASKISELSSQSLSSFIDGWPLTIEINEEIFSLKPEDIIINRKEKSNIKVLNDGSLTVAFDTDLSEDLVMESMIRDLVRAIQNKRKDKQFSVTDKILLFIECDDFWMKAIKHSQNYLLNETLGKNLEFKKLPTSELLNLKGKVYLDITRFVE